jgi:hypothetical protein
MMFLDCPAYLDQEGAARCGLPAEVRCWFTMRSADGPVESAMIRCSAGHSFSGPVEALSWDSSGKHDPGATRAGSRAGGGLAARRNVPGSPRRHARRPVTAPAYYLGRPAGQWTDIMRPRRRLATGAGAR